MFEIDILPQFGINPRVLEYDSANNVTCYLNRGKIFLYTRDPNWIPPEYKVAMSALSQSDWNKILIYD